MNVKVLVSLGVGVLCVLFPLSWLMLWAIGQLSLENSNFGIGFLAGMSCAVGVFIVVFSLKKAKEGGGLE